MPSFSIDLSEILCRRTRSAQRSTLCCRPLRFWRCFLPFSFRIGNSRMFHVKHSAVSCFFSLFLRLFCSLSFHPSFFTFSRFVFFPVLFSSFCVSFGAFFAFCVSRVIFGRVFLDLGVVFAPFSSFRVLFLYSFRSFCIFWLDITVLPGWIGGFSPSFCSFSLFFFMFLPCFFVFCSSRVIFGGVFLFFFPFFRTFYCVPRFAVAFLCSFSDLFCLFALLG